MPLDDVDRHLAGVGRQRADQNVLDDLVRIAASERRKTARRSERPSTPTQPGVRDHGSQFTPCSRMSRAAAATVASGSIRDQHRAHQLDPLSGHGPGTGHATVHVAWMLPPVLDGLVSAMVAMRSASRSTEQVALVADALGRPDRRDQQRRGDPGTGAWGGTDATAVVITSATVVRSSAAHLTPPGWQRPRPVRGVIACRGGADDRDGSARSTRSQPDRAQEGAGERTSSAVPQHQQSGVPASLNQSCLRVSGQADHLHLPTCRPAR